MNLNAICIGINSRSSNETARYRSLALDFASPLQPFDSRITYSGASARMYFDSTGTLKFAPMNLLLRSTEFSTSPWATTSVGGTGVTPVLTSGQADPFGGTEAFRLQADRGAGNAAGDFSDLSQTLSGLTNPHTATVSIYAKSNTGVSQEVYFRNVAGRGGSLITVTTAWQRFDISGSVDLTTDAIRIGSRGTINSTNSVDILIYGAQFQTTPLSDYVPTTTAAVYLPRSNAYQDHNPSTLAPLGFLIEEQRTNSIRNNTMQGAVVGSPGTVPTNWSGATAGLTRNIVGTGTSGGIPYVDIQFVGTSSGTAATIVFEAQTQVVATSGQTWALSEFVSIVGGTTTNITAINMTAVESDAAGTGSIVTTTVRGLLSGLTGNLQRFSATRTISAGTTERINSRLTLTFSSGVAIDITLRIGLPQLELGAFATSPILTSGAAATRLVDSASITGTNFSSWYNQTEGTFVVKWRDPASSKARYPLWAGITAEQIAIGANASNILDFRIVSGGVDTYSGNTITLSAQEYTAALAYKTNDGSSAVTGNSAVTDASVTLPATAPVALRIGATDTGTSPLNGHIQSLTYYRKRLADAILQSLTS